MTIWQATRSGSRQRPVALPDRLDAWHRDASARAFAIARWEDDGGFAGSLRVGPDRPLSSEGSMSPFGSRDI